MACSESLDPDSIHTVRPDIQPLSLFCAASPTRTFSPLPSVLISPNDKRSDDVHEAYI